MLTNQKCFAGDVCRHQFSPPGQHVLRRRDDDLRIYRKDIRGSFQLCGRTAHDGQIDLIIGKLAHDRLTIIDIQL